MIVGDIERCHGGATQVGYMQVGACQQTERSSMASRKTAQVVNGPAGKVGSTKLSALKEIRPLYFLPADPLAEEVLIPCFCSAETVDCMVGFFSSTVLSELAPGLAAFIANSDESFRLVVSPYIREEDKKAIEEGTRSPEDIAEALFEEFLVTEDALERHALRCLSHLLRIGRIEIRIAVMKDALFHPKLWMFEREEEVLAAHGSSNLTRSGIRKNFEQINVSRSWEDGTQSYVVEKFKYQFERLWSDHEDDCVVVDLPKAVENDLLRAYGSVKAPSEDEFMSLYRRASGNGESDGPAILEPVAPKKSEFVIPNWLHYEDGPFAHQGKAVNAWCGTGFRGVLEMATGSGKTITSMICAHKLFELHKPLLIVVAAPYVPLIQQWCDEIRPFGLEPVNLTITGGAAQRAKELGKVRRRLRIGLSNAEAVVVSHDTLCSEAFLATIEQFECDRLLIADEAHNLGREAFITNPPEFFEHRLALSATPVRQYDPEGTRELFDFFGGGGKPVFRFTLEEAIGTCLVEYDYHLHPVHLTETEMDEWYELTEKIRANAWRDDNGKPDEYLSKLLRDRRALLETAEGKVASLARLLADENLTGLRHTLIYTTDKAPAQLEQINRLLESKGLLFHQLTAAETSDREKTRRIIRSFQDGEIQVLTAKRVLDEGVNIPQICRAYILASTTVERQWVQRRGRLLRACSAIGKTHSIIHDFLALPPNIDGELDADAPALVKGELKRAQEFSGLAKNAGRNDGPLGMIDRLVNAAYL